MTQESHSSLLELEHAIKQAISGEVRFDRTARLLYSTDASIYQIEPLGVAFPRDGDELAACVALAASYGMPVLARGAGSSLAGQAIGPALILDCSRHLDRQIEINPEEKSATVEPGVVLDALNRAAAAYGLQFGPDPASGERATLGGSLANNATGAHSILYGMAADHLISAEVILADGSPATFVAIPLEQAYRRAGLEIDRKLTGLVESAETAPAGLSLEAKIYRAALQIRSEYRAAIQENWPRTWRRASGYNLNYLLPWSPSQPPLWRDSPYPPVREGQLNLAPLLAGSEGTLAVIRRAKVRLVARPQHNILGMLAYPSLAAACQAVPALLELEPSAIELIPESLIRLARSVPAYAHQLGCLEPLCKDGIPPVILIVEFSGEERDGLKQQALRLEPGVLVAESAAEQKQAWGVRKVGLGILMSRPGDTKPLPFIEDLSVPVEHLGAFVGEMQRIFTEHGTQGDFYAHASAGCLHIRPLIDLKTAQGVASLRAIAGEAVELAIRLGGVASGEHGDGLARSEWIERTFGKEILAAFRLLKRSADPNGLLNPGKILDPPPMDDNLRFGPDYQPSGWATVMDFSGQVGLVGAVEQCNGAGVCRKAGGVMCPSFQVTGDEMHNTRGRANLLRAMLSGQLEGAQSEGIVREALDLCLACKGCKAECPSAVDMAKLKYEFLNHYYRPGSGHRRSMRDYLFAYVGLLGRFGHPLAPLINAVFAQPVFRRLSEGLLGISRHRHYPVLSRQTLRTLVSDATQTGSAEPGQVEPVIFLSDPFTEYFDPEIRAGLAAIRALQEAGCQVHLLPVIGAGRTLISKGFLKAARDQASRVVQAIYRLDPQGRMPVIGVEPSEIYTLRDEYPELLPGDARAAALASRAYMIDEFLVRPGRDGVIRLLRIVENSPGNRTARGAVLLHGHCYQKAQPPAADGYAIGTAATVAMLEAFGYPVSLIEAGCCGMAGAFGYEREHYQLSTKVGELALFPAIRKTGREVKLAATGISCQEQILDGTGRAAVHPIRLPFLEREESE